MKQIVIIGNLCRDPELRTTQSGIPVCSFTVAVNRRKTPEAGQPEADFFRVTTWRKLAELCSKYLAKGRKVAVVGEISLQQYNDANGLPRYSMEVQADEVEFLTPRTADAPPAPEQTNAWAGDDPGSDLPF